MTQTQFFEWLGAPLVNTRWSWGSVRSDGIVFLRAWQDETMKLDDIRYMRVLTLGVKVDTHSSAGYEERRSHLDLVKKGAKCFIVMVEADPTKLPQRHIRSFNSDEVFVGGSLREHKGYEWIELGERIAAAKVRI